MLFRSQSETEFFAAAVDAQVDFQRDEKGVATKLTIHQGDRVLVAQRKSGEVAERQEVKLPAQVLERYAGTYQLRPGTNFSVTLQGDQLMGQIPGRPPFPMFAESETRFFIKVVDAQVEFLRDEHGAVTALVLYQGLQATKAPRQ